jgi:hypothetical protein
MQAPFEIVCACRAGLLPRRLFACTQQMHYASGFSGKRTPRIRLCGRSAHEASVIMAKRRGPQMRVAVSSPPRTTPDAAAPV